jgi:hypothetical protein
MTTMEALLLLARNTSIDAFADQAFMGLGAGSALVSLYELCLIDSLTVFP